MKKKIIFFLLFINCVFFLFSQDKKDFKVFNALLFKDTPDLTEYGFSEINMIYEDGVISTNYHKKKGEFTWRFVDSKKISKQSSRSKNKADVPIVLDVEYWGHLLYSGKTKEEAEDIFLQLIRTYRANDPNSLVSVFHYGAISERILMLQM